MADETVTWDELKEFCRDKQAACHALLDQKQANQALQIESERRHGMTDLYAKVDKLVLEMTALKDMLSSRSVWVLPKPILVLLCVGMIAVGVAGEKLISLAAKYFVG